MPVSREARTLSGCDIGRTVEFLDSATQFRGELWTVHHKRTGITVRVKGRSIEEYPLDPHDLVTVSGADQ